MNKLTSTVLMVVGVIAVVLTVLSIGVVDTARDKLTQTEEALVIADRRIEWLERRLKNAEDKSVPLVRSCSCLPLIIQGGERTSQECKCGK